MASLKSTKDKPSAQLRPKVGCVKRSVCFSACQSKLFEINERLEAFTRNYFRASGRTLRASLSSSRKHDSTCTSCPFFPTTERRGKLVDRSCVPHYNVWALVARDGTTGQGQAVKAVVTGCCFNTLPTSPYISQPPKGHDLLPSSLKCGCAHIEPLVGSRECGAGQCRALGGTQESERATP